MDVPTRKVARRDVLLRELLNGVLEMIEALDDGTATRELRASALIYRESMDQWGAVRPTVERCDAMFEVISELQSRVVAERETQRAARSEPT